MNEWMNMRIYIAPVKQSLQRRYQPNKWFLCFWRQWWSPQFDFETCLRISLERNKPSSNVKNIANCNHCYSFKRNLVNLYINRNTVYKQKIGPEFRPTERAAITPSIATHSCHFCHAVVIRNACEYSCSLNFIFVRAECFCGLRVDVAI